MHSAMQADETMRDQDLDAAQRCAYSAGMTVEERLDRLTERHEALTLNVELLTKDVRDLAQEMRSLGALVKDVALGTARLLHAVEGHERRIGALEDRSESQ